MMVNYDVIKKFTNSDELELQYHKIVSDISKVTDLDFALDVIFRYHRRNGYPHYNVPMQNRIRQFKSLKNFDESSLFKGGKINQTMHGLSLAWTYFPHWVEVECGNNKMKPIDYWNDDVKLKEPSTKTIQEIDREKLDVKFAKKDKDKLN